MKRTQFLKVLMVGMLVACGTFTACRGGVSHKPPIHLVWDMDFQQKIKAQSAFDFPGWTDHRGMRMPVAGTVARGTLDNAQLGKFKNAAGDFIANPLPATFENMIRGQERFNIYCAVCHDRAGSGQGVVLQRAPAGSFNSKVPDLGVDERLRGLRDGELYETITNGKATMPAYAHMITVEDRWCIVHYLRALQNRITKP